MSFFGNLLDTNGFMPRWNCGHWTEPHGWLHIFSDSTIFAAYFTIPILLVYFIKKRDDIPFPPVLFLFAAFILLCGIGHLIEASIFWHPWYRLSGTVKGATALVSIATAIALAKTIPQALALPSRIQAEAKNVWLNRIINSTPHALVFLDGKLRIKFISKRTFDIIGNPRYQYTNLDISILLPAKKIDALKESLASLLTETPDKSLSEGQEITIFDKNNQEIHVELYASLTTSPENTPLIICSITEISNKIKARTKKLEAWNHELERSNKELDSFAYIASHDLRSPPQSHPQYRRLDRVRYRR